MSEDRAPMWVVYDHPFDWPEHFVARLWMNAHPTPTCLFADTLEGLREKLPCGLYRMDRHYTDDPSIVEVWL